MKLNWDTEIPSDFIKEWDDLLKILNDWFYRSKPKCFG